jgi:hypothetical protein
VDLWDVHASFHNTRIYSLLRTLTFPENRGTKLRQQKILVENEVKKINHKSFLMAFEKCDTAT